MALTKEESALRAWAARLGRVFGMSVAMYRGVVRLQNGQCPICMRPVPDPELPGDSRRFPVDHDHKSGEVRGIPCGYCNKYRIGRWTAADLDTLRRVVAYLENPPARQYFGGPLIVPGHGKRKRKTTRKRKQPVPF